MLRILNTPRSHRDPNRIPESHSEPSGFYSRYVEREWIKTIRKNTLIELLRGIFSIILVNTIVTTFNLIFYIFVVYPTIQEAVKNSLVSSNSNNSENKLYKIIDVLKKREYDLIYKVNEGSYGIIVIIILLLICVLLYIYKSLSTLSKTVEYKDILISSGITTCLLLCFQGLFFKFGIGFYYTGIYGPEEAIYRFITNIMV
jgi:hypothetical protein